MTQGATRTHLCLRAGLERVYMHVDAMWHGSQCMVATCWHLQLCVLVGDHPSRAGMGLTPYDLDILLSSAMNAAVLEGAVWHPSMQCADHW
jgi:hypothetical protein